MASHGTIRYIGSHSLSFFENTVLACSRNGCRHLSGAARFNIMTLSIIGLIATPAYTFLLCFFS